MFVDANQGGQTLEKGKCLSLGMGTLSLVRDTQRILGCKGVPSSVVTCGVLVDCFFIIHEAIH